MLFQPAPCRIVRTAFWRSRRRRRAEHAATGSCETPSTFLKLQRHLVVGRLPQGRELRGIDGFACVHISLAATRAFMGRLSAHVADVQTHDQHAPSLATSRLLRWSIRRHARMRPIRAASVARRSSPGSIAPAPVGTASGGSDSPDRCSHRRAGVSTSTGAHSRRGSPLAIVRS